MEITVTNTGQGIPETDLPHIFDKFYRGESEPEASASGTAGTAAPGVGLGLYLAQHIVSQLDGKLTVESKRGIGTTFRVTLPLDLGDVAAEKSKESADVKALVGS